MKKQIIQNIKAITLGVIVVIGVSYASADVYNAPASDCLPPDCNASTLINVGSQAQVKEGALTLMHLFTPDLTVTNSDGSQVTKGYVLTAQNKTGKVIWAPLSARN